MNKKIYLIYSDDSDEWSPHFDIIKFVDSEEKAIKEMDRLEKEEPRVNAWGDSIYFYREYEVY